MSKFIIEVNEKDYEMEYTRDNIRQFESLGGSMKDLQEKIFTSIDTLRTCIHRM